jgi:hypothetical protein
MKRMSRFPWLKPGPRADSGFAGYQWQVVTITKGGKETPIPAQYHVYLKFSKDGEFSAHDHFNIHNGTYRTTSDGLTTNHLMSSLVGYAGDDPDIALAIDAISAFNRGDRATATVAGDRLSVTVGEYLLGCQRDGVA